jgi:serine/threonine protein kinase
LSDQKPPKPAEAPEDLAAVSGPVGSIPPGFHATVVRAQSIQVDKGLGIEASIVPEDLDLEIVVDAADTAHIPTEEVSRKGKRLRIGEAGELEAGPKAEDAAYEVLEILGAGGMGVVCLARQKSLQREVALKIARKTKSNAQGTTRADLEMFTNEAYTTASLDHPNVVPVYTLAKDPDGRLYFTMKRVSGTCWEHLLSPSLIRNRVERGKVQQRAARMSLDDHLDILLKVGNALAYAHDKGVLHRDVKPENVMLGAYGEVLLMDWGLAMKFGDDSNPYRLDPNLVPQLVGTPAYLAPEMARGLMTEFGPQTDIYLLGASLYRVLTGRPPHWGEGIAGAVNKAASGKVDPPEEIARDRNINPEISRITMKALAANMGQRYQTIKEFQADLREYLAHDEALAISDNANCMLMEIQDQIAKGGAPQASRNDPVILPVDKDRAALVYGRLSECIGAYRQSLGLWACNDEALVGLLAALILQVKLAMHQDDLTLARAHIDLMETIAGPEVDADWAKQVRAQQARIEKDLERLLRRKQAILRREKLQRRLTLAVILLLLAGVAGSFTLVVQQMSSALDDLRTSERQRQVTKEALNASKKLQKKIFANSVASQARLVAQYLRGLETTVSLYSQQAIDLMGMPKADLPPRATTPAGRDGFYLDPDFYDPRTRPPDLKLDPRYGKPMSQNHPTVKLAPWAMAGAARTRALATTARLARLGKVFSQMHRAREDILWSVVGSTTGVLVAFPGSGRYRQKPEYDPTKRPWYLGAIEAEQTTPRWVDPHVDAGGKGLLITCVSPIRLGNRNLGVVGAEVSMQALQHMLLEFTRLSGGRARGLLIRDDNLVVVDTAYTVDPSRWQDRFALNQIDQLGEEVAGYYRGALAGQINPAEATEIETDQGTRLFSHARLGQPNWILLVTIDRTAILHSKD